MVRVVQGLELSFLCALCGQYYKECTRLGATPPSRCIMPVADVVLVADSTEEVNSRLDERQCRARRGVDSQ